MSILHGPEMDWRWAPGGTRHKKEVAPKKKALTEETVCQGHHTGSKHRSQDLLESIMKPIHFVKQGSEDFDENGSIWIQNLII